MLKKAKVVASSAIEDRSRNLLLRYLRLHPNSNYSLHFLHTCLLDWSVNALSKKERAYDKGKNHILANKKELDD